MEKAREYSAVKPNTYANIWKVVGALVVAGFAAWLFGPAKERGQMYQAFDWTWELQEHTWNELDGAYRLDVILLPVYARTKERGIHFKEETWMGLCGAVLSSLPASPNDELRRKDVYRVSINVRNADGSLIVPRDVPVSVENGACLGATNGIFPVRYPNEMADWVLKRYDISNKHSLFGKERSKELKVSFEWTGEGEENRSTFPFVKACAYILADPPIELLDILQSNDPDHTAPDTMIVKVGKQIGTALFHVGTYQSQSFNIVGNICVPEDEGEPT